MGEIKICRRVHLSRTCLEWESANLRDIGDCGLEKQSKVKQASFSKINLKWRGEIPSIKLTSTNFSLKRGKNLGKGLQGPLLGTLWIAAYHYNYVTDS